MSWSRKISKRKAARMRCTRSNRFGVTGKMLVNEGKIQLAYTQIKKRPLEVRTEATLQGMTAVQAFDGKDGWQISPFHGRKDPEKMSADDVKSLIEDAEIGRTAGRLESERQHGRIPRHEKMSMERHAYKLKVDAQERRREFCLSRSGPFSRDPDRDPAHPARRAGRSGNRPRRLRKGRAASLFRFQSKPVAKGDPDKQKIIIDKAEANIPVDDAIFHFPATPSK